MELNLIFTEVTCEQCDGTFSFGPDEACQHCGTRLPHNEFGETDPVVQKRLESIPAVLRMLRPSQSAQGPEQTLVDEEEVRSWVSTFLNNFGGVAVVLIEEISAEVTREPVDEPSLIGKIRQLQEFASAPHRVHLPENWRLAHSLLKGIAKSLVNLVSSLADALEARTFSDALTKQDDFQGHFDRAEALASNFDFALAGIKMAAGVPLTEALPGRVGESLGDVGTRAVLFAKHYYGLNDDLGPDLGWGLSISAFNIEGSREPVRRSREVHQLIKWLLPSHPWRLPSHLVEDLQQAAERGGSIEGLQAALEQHTQGLALDEEKARLVGRISEEVLRPLMIILAYLTEGEDVPERYLLIRRETLATVASGLAPRLPAELTFLAEVPVRFRHAYAHGGIGNDGVSVVLDLIEPTERVVVTSEEIDAELESLLQKVLVYVPAILVSLKNRFQITGDSFALPARMVAVETELLFALAGLDVKVRTQVGSVYVTCTALPSHPVRLLSLSAGVKHVVPQATTLIVDCGSEPTFEVELDSLPNRSPEGVECLLLRYRLLTDWCSPSLIDKNDPGAREAELAAPIMRFLWGLLGELIDEEDHEEALRRIRIAERESRRAADQFEPDRRRTSNLRSAFEAADQLKRDCRRVLPLFSQRPWADIKAHGFLTRPERLTALVESFAHQGIEPTLFAGELV